jgi:hypothetical protein
VEIPTIPWCLLTTGFLPLLHFLVGLWKPQSFNSNVGYQSDTLLFFFFTDFFNMKSVRLLLRWLREKHPWDGGVPLMCSDAMMKGVFQLLSKQLTMTKLTEV